MAEGNISPTEFNRNASVSRVNNRQAEDSNIRQAEVIARQKASEETRAQASAETQLGRNVDLRA